MTLSESIAKSLGWALGLFAVCAVSMAWVWYSTPLTYNPGTSADVMAIRPHADGTVEAVSKAHKCKKTIEGIYPTGVIYTDRDDRAHFSASKIVIGQALDNHFDDVPWRNTPAKFCR